MYLSSLLARCDVTPRTRVAVYGNSLHMAGVAVSLQASPALDVVRMFAHEAGFAQRLAELEPAVVVFDPAEAPPDLAAAVLHERPGVLLVSIDPNSDQALLWSSQRSSALSMQDLVRVITGGRGSVF